ncbi:sulfite exporter TauE/SafE family protein [Methanolobus chelungpuianus]|uniref:Probable membrane transporter protein n=1 Tax=Methanolobus chelungpuianus TaxID=502115 RepID=A0AAE3KZ06_9EURY|nr:sulfite exporter TauE/SafE family protein [Methanolobus chelungpuianus]MCQ6963319.1 permease [Methanolobus chelungpuianus]
MENIFLIITVFITSVLFSMLGIGGAIFYVPFFYGTGMELLNAITTALLLNIVTSGSAATLYLRKKMVDLQAAVPLILFAAIGTQIGGYLARLTPVDVLLFLFSIQMIFIGAEMLFARFEKYYKGKEISGKKKKFLVTGGGLIIGILSGLLGVGGGSFVVPMLIIMGYGIKCAAATSGFVVVFASLSAFLAHVWTWEPDITLVLYIIVASFLGAQVGSRLMYSRVKADTLRKILGVLLLIMAARILTGLL